MSLPPPIPNQRNVATHLNDYGYSLDQLKAYGQACREQALEDAAVCAWSHYMDTCKLNNIAPASSERWLVAGKIRSLK